MKIDTSLQTRDMRVLIIDIYNDSFRDRKVELFGASKNVRHLNKYGNYKKSGITIKSMTNPADYGEILHEIIANPIQCEEFYLMKINELTINPFNNKTTSRSKLLRRKDKEGEFLIHNEIIFEDKSINGYTLQRLVKFHINKDQVQKHIVKLPHPTSYKKNNYTIDGLSRLKFKMFARTSLRFHIYFTSKDTYGPSHHQTENIVN